MCRSERVDLGQVANDVHFGVRVHIHRKDILPPVSAGEIPTAGTDIQDFRPLVEITKLLREETPVRTAPGGTHIRSPNKLL